MMVRQRIIIFVLSGLYTGLFYLCLPLIFFRLWLRGFKAPDYRKRWVERLGFFSAKVKPNGIWIHAVSVGETIAAKPLIEQLQQRYPNTPITVTTMTPTGSHQVKSLFNETVFHVYVPYDIPSAVKRFIKHIRPKLLIIMETELWPNMIQACHETKIPVLLANARLSERSFKGYQKAQPWIGHLVKKLSYVTAQYSTDSEHFRALGVSGASMTIAGSMKFDLSMPEGLKEQADLLKRRLGEQRKIWIAASTHRGEDEIILKAHQAVKAEHNNAMLVIVPRHPERFNQVAELICAEGFSLARRSDDSVENQDVLLVDTMGELLLFYGIADVAFVGGSLVATGGHNPLEPALWSKPIIMGPHVYNFRAITQMLNEHQALITIEDGALLAEKVNTLFSSEAQRLSYGKKAYQVLSANQGALKTNLLIIEQLLAKR